MLSKLFGRTLKKTAVFLIHFYQIALSRIFGGQCRFYPSCSAYALEAYETHGFFLATRLTLFRLSKCHPMGSQGYDPIPPVLKEQP